MILGIGKELSVFLQAVLAGNIIYLAYSVIRVVRRLWKHNLFFVSLEDLIFWIGTGIYLFVRIYQTSDGIIRWYFVIGVLLGGIVTHFIIFQISKKYIAKRRKKE
ncbi:MAG: spore cortex biosynthesis protein YabQ [Faecalimonas sp.]|nr:spore cortex biosynthesis protein YabQ [Faecalimonas sp.]